MKSTIIYICSIAALITILVSCASIKPAGVKTGQKLFETFFVGDAGTQYFIKPLTFSNTTKEELKFDITFIYKNKIDDSATVNISYMGNQLLKSADSLKIGSEFNTVIIKELKYMFSERSKKMYNCRFSAKVNLADVIKLFANDKWNINLYKNGEFIMFSAPKSTKKKIDKLNYQIFAIVK